MQPPKDRLEDIGILSLLSDDDRPTFILERSAPHFSGHLNSQIAYRNAALEAFIQRASSVADFEDWARTLSVDTTHTKSWRFVGRAWTSTTISRRWLVVYCSQAQHVVQSPLSREYMRESVGPTYRARNTSISINGLDSPLTHKPSQVFSDSGDTVSHALDVAPSFPTLMEYGVTEPKIIDWTRHHIEVPEFIQYFKNYDFAATALGPLSSWPDDLRRLVVCMFSNPDPRVILYGPSLALIYNEAAVVRIGSKHPWAMGRPASEAFAEIWPQVAPIVRPAIFEGKAIKVVKELFFMERDAMLEETYWNFIMSPMLGDNGYACGAIDSFSETTMNVIIQRRRDMVVRMTQETSGALTLKQLWQKFLTNLEAYGTDAPYAVVFASDENETATSSSSRCTGTRAYTLEGTLGIPADCPGIPRSFDLSDPVSDDSQDQCLANACRRAWDHRQTIILQTEDGSLPDDLRQAVPGRGWGDAVRTVFVMAISTTASGPLGFLVLGFNPRRPYNEESLRFAHSVRDTLARSAWRIGQSRFEEIHDALALQVRVSSLEAARNEEKFTKLAEASPVGICTLGGDGRTLYVNDEYLRLLGIARSFDNKTLWESNAWQNEVVPSDLEVISEAWDNLIQRKVTSTTVKYRSKRPWRSIDKATGREMVGETWLLNKAVVELDDEDNVLYVHAWLLDISHQHYTEKIMTQRLNDALENKRASENFIDMVSHELRNPLSAILQSADGIITMLEETLSQDISKHTSLQEVISEASSTIVLCSQHMKSIVDDILTLSKLDSNLLVITPDKAQPPSLIEKVLKMYESELKRTKVEARLVMEQSYNQILHNDDYVMLDPSRMLQVIINLLTNAIKFTQFMDERTIKIYLGASYGRPSGASHNLTFIEPRTIRRGSSTASSSEWGDGQEIFLQICVEDTGRGLSAEEISLLFQRFSQASPKTYKQYGGSGLGLFISRELTELQGGQIGVSSKGVGRGSSFSFYIRAQRCVLKDNKEGLSPVALQYVWDTSVIAPVVSQAHETPVHSTEVRTNLAPEKPRLSRVPTKRRYRKDDKVDQESTTQALHVLIVEDNLINQKVMAQQLRRIGCVVHIANHGLECLSFLQKTPFWRPDGSTLRPEADPVSDTIPLSVVLMDWEMPTMDGLTCVREIRRLQESGELTSHVPVIGCTANARTEQISIAMEAGMDNLVTKPFRIPDLLPQMKALVAKHSATSA